MQAHPVAMAANAAEAMLGMDIVITILWPAAVAAVVPAVRWIGGPTLKVELMM